MPRLTDIIKQGKIPEKEKEKEYLSTKDSIRFRDLPSFKESRRDAPTREELDRYEGIDSQLPKETEDARAEVTAEGMAEGKDFDWLYQKIYSFVEDIVSVAASGGKLNIDEGVKSINYIVNNLDSLDVLYLKAIYTEESLDPFISHFVNVAIYALTVGIGLKYSKDELTKLGIAALLHDIGMAKIPRHIISKTEKLTPDEFQLIRKHPQYGYELLHTLGEDYEWLAEIARDEHEREEGQGYPRGLKGGEINANAKIIALVDAYEAISHPRSYKKYLLPHYAVKEILNTSRGFFPPNIIKALVGRLSIFPLYSYVRLNSGYIGRVIEIDEAHPLRPTVDVLFDPQKKKVNKIQRIKLSDTPILYITGAVDKGELPDLNAVVG